MDGRAAKCVTHHICDCLLARLQAAERVCELAKDSLAIRADTYFVRLAFLQAHGEWEAIRAEARLLSEIPEAQVEEDT